MTVAVTRGAEGFPRRAFSVDDVRLMIEVGVFGPEEKFELIEGEIVPMSPKRDPHERVKSALIIAVSRNLPNDLWLGVESSVYFADRTFLEPDLCLYARNLKLADVRGRDLVLVIEVSDTSRTFDLGLKARLYATFGVNELWVVDAETRATTVHAGPTAAGWASIREVSATEELVPTSIPGIRVRLAELD